MTVAQSAKETEAEGLRTAQPEGEASGARAFEDILERAKASLKRYDPINQGFYTSIPSEDVQIWKELIADAERLRSALEKYNVLKLDNVVCRAALNREIREGLERRQQLNDAVYKLGYDLAATKEEITAKDAQIKDLEAEKRRLEARVEYCHDQTKLIERLEAALLEAKRCPTCNGKGVIRDPYLSRVRGLIIDESIDRICPMCEGKGEEKAREALERIKEGGKDD